MTRIERTIYALEKFVVIGISIYLIAYIVKMAICNRPCNDLGALIESKYAEKNRLKESATIEKITPT
jgi:hypothetical protein